MVSALLSGDREFLSVVARCGPASIATLCEAAGVTPTAVRQRLQRLEGRELIVRKAVRADRGRPHHVYEITDAGRRELGHNYTDLAVMLWDELRQIEEEPIRQRVLDRIRKAMVSQYSQQVTGDSPAERLGELAAALAERGFPVESGRKESSLLDLPVLREHACPYHEIAAHDATICELEQSVFSEVVGSKLELTHCCQRGDRMCEFEAASPVGISKTESSVGPVPV
jgi:predicted ArsR family transcriptional regulator